MKKAAVLCGLVVLVFASYAFSQEYSQAIDCESLINDGAHVVHDTGVVYNTAQRLVNEGADVKVVTLASLTFNNLTEEEKQIEQNCTSWRSPAGGRKANLVVFMVSLKEHKKNIFFGGAYSGPFPSEDSVNTLYSRAANPYFKAGQFDQGFAAAMKDFAAAVVAYHDQQKHPATTTITNEATDLSGFFRFLVIALGVAVCVLVFGFIMKALARRQAEKDDRDAAQAAALQERTAAQNAYVEMSKDDPGYYKASAQFAGLAGSVKYDPNEEMSTADYKAAEKAWREFRNGIEGKPGAPEKTTVRQATPYARRRQDPTRAEPQPPQQQTTVVNNSGINNSGSSLDGIATGVLLDEALRPSRYREPEPDPPEPQRSYREPEQEAPSSYGGSGSDSSWDSSSSDSSGGSDSSFGGGGSDGGSGSDSSF